MVRTTRLAIASVMGLTMLVGMPMSAQAQDRNGQINMDLEQVDVREALRALFKSMGTSYSVAPEVQGVVTVNLHNVPFETALQNVLKQVNATYRLVGGVYEIVNREEPKPDKGGDVPTAPPPDTKVTRKVYLNHADPMFVATLIASSSTNFSLAPEMSTVIKTRGFGGNGGSGNGSGGFGGGFGGSGNGSNSGNGGFGNNGFGNNSGGPGNGNRGGGNFGRGG